MPHHIGYRRNMQVASITLRVAVHTLINGVPNEAIATATPGCFDAAGVFM